MTVWTVTVVRVLCDGFLCDRFRHADAAEDILCPSIVLSFRLLDFSVDFDKRFLLYDAAIAVFTGSANTHVQLSDHFHGCSPGRKERSKSILLHCSSDELFWFKLGCLTP